MRFWPSYSPLELTVAVQLEHFDKFNCGSIILGVKGDIGSNLIAKWVYYMHVDTDE